MKPLPPYFLVRVKRYFETFLMMRKWGHLRSALSGSVVDAKGTPLPWWSYPAIHLFNNRLSFIGVDVFEWGCGASTCFFLDKGARVVSVENDEKWAAKVKIWARDNHRSERLQLKIRFGIDDYVNEIYLHKPTWSVIVVDGLIHHAADKSRAIRHECALATVKEATDETIIVLDNADWVPATCRTLRESGWMEIPFIGPAPLVPYTTTTSVFVRRMRALTNFFAHQYEATPGSIEVNYERNIYPTYTGQLWHD
jgi:hypothetical protein